MHVHVGYVNRPSVWNVHTHTHTHTHLKFNAHAICAHRYTHTLPLLRVEWNRGCQAVTFFYIYKGEGMGALGGGEGLVVKKRWGVGGRTGIGIMNWRVQRSWANKTDVWLLIVLGETCAHIFLVECLFKVHRAARCVCVCLCAWYKICPQLTRRLCGKVNNACFMKCLLSVTWYVIVCESLWKKYIYYI